MSTTVSQQTEGKDAARSQPLKYPSGLFRKLTTRFKPPTLHPKSANPETASPPTSPTQPSTRRPVVPIASTHVAAMKRRQAALQQCGLVPLPRKDLSQLEAELDRRFTRVVVLPQDEQDQAELSSAERIRREWQAKNEVQPVKQGDDADSKDPNDVPSDSLNLENEEAQRVPSPPDPAFSLQNPVSLPPIPETFSIPEVSEEDVATSKDAKEIVTPRLQTIDPLIIPLPDSPLSSFVYLPDLPSPTPLRESKRLPPIVINLENGTDETQGQVTRGRSLNRDSPQSLASRPSLPALSPTKTASSTSSIPTPRDDDSRERMEAEIIRSNSVKSRSSRFGRFSHIRHHSEELSLVHETIPEGPEFTMTESRTWYPNRESSTAMDSIALEESVQKRQKRRKSTGFFQLSKRNSGSIRSSRKSTSSDLSSMWSAIANDFSLKPLDGSKSSRSSILPSTLTPANKNRDLASSQLQTANQPKITRSKSVIASLGFKMTRKAAQPASSPSPPSLPMRLPTFNIVENRENLFQEVRGIQDDESRRLTELAFMDF